MMHFSQCEDLVIASGTDVSRVVDANKETADAETLGILGAVALTGTLTIEVCPTANGTFVTLNNGTSDVAGPAAGKAIEYNNFAFPYWRLKSSSNEGADRTLKLYKLWNVR